MSLTPTRASRLQILSSKGIRIYNVNIVSSAPKRKEKEAKRKPVPIVLLDRMNVKDQRYPH
jgi:hypothetical protein